DHLRHSEGLARASDAEQHLGALVAFDDGDQFGDRLGLVALGLEVGLDDEAVAALGLLRPRRTVRRPRPVGELAPAFAQQPVERARRLRRAGHAAAYGDGVVFVFFAFRRRYGQRRQWRLRHIAGL